ncbi:hypothetical protein [Sphingomonas sp. Leaf242]|uniref:hypothetical protein n=1 Tax=Sphingomonas sp. Leaf242 TaxID=1736304 RepID=UPI000714DB02|nr:hypothetical protein [Sphingomonas sp. Leaf242]KQO12765.1 hypothetical protein ASF09_00085 [Sphingomonas sp. Leaf242]
MTWTAFSKQYEAKGREKADGYFPFHFEGMDANELTRARALMETRGSAGDTTDLDGLRLIGDAGSIAVLEAAEAQDKRLGIAFECARRETLFALTGNARFLAPLIDRLDTREDRDSAFAAQAIARHQLPPSFATVLAARIADGRHETALLWIIKAWLSAQGEAIWQVPVFDANLSFIRSVIAERPAARRALLETWRM